MNTLTACGAVLHLSRDGEDLRRVLKNHEVRKVHLNDLIHRDSQVFGLNGVLEWFDGLTAAGEIFHQFANQLAN